MKIFYDENASKTAIKTAGELFLLAMYKSITSKSLDELRYFKYCQAISKIQIQAKFNLAILPPTEGSAEQHSYRVYHQIQAWKGNNLDASNWGWELKNGILRPITSSLPPVPRDVLHLVACNCKKGCSRNCSCKRNGLICSAMCGHCEGQSCDNSPEKSIEIETDPVELE